MNATRLRRMTALILICCGVVCGICSFGNPLPLAAESLKGRIEFDRKNIRADQPAAWPKEVSRMVPVPRQEFISLIEQLDSKNLAPRSAWLKSAHYEATLVNDTLQTGVMTASVQRLGTNSTLLDLGNSSFALEHLKWQDRPAIWGSAVDGRAWLLLDGIRDELLGEWSCRGREFPGGVDFDLQLPPATVSMLDLRIPSEFVLFAPTAEVSLLSGSASDATRLWRIQCGSDSRCRVTVVRREGLEESRPALLVENDMQVVVLEDGLRFQLNLYLDALDAAVQDLTLKLPTGLLVYSATYGIDTPLPVQRTPEAEAQGRLPIRLPGPLSGRRRTLRVDGIMVHKPGQPTTVPQVVVENSIFDSGILAVTVQSPLQVRSIRSHGYRQRTTDGDSMTFQQLTPDAQLILDVHRAQVSLSSRSVNLLDVDDDSWNLTSDIVLNSQSGGAYQVSCLYPPEWEVTDVSLPDQPGRAFVDEFSDEAEFARETAKLNWNTQPQPGGKSLLAIEFLESIQPGQARTIRLQARRKPPLAGQTEPVPLPQMVNCDVSEVIFGIQVPPSLTPVLSTDSRLERIATPSPAIFTQTPERPNSERRWYRSDSIDGSGTIQLKPKLQPVRVRTETVIDALPAEYRLKYSIQFEQDDVESDRILIYLTETGPDIRWTWKGSQTLDLSAVRLPKSQHIEWNLPSKGELWEIRLPRGTTRGITIEGNTTQRWLATNRPALVYVPQAVEKLSELKVVRPDSIDVTFDTDGLKRTGERLSWWYVAPQAQIDLSLRNPEPTRDFPLMVSMQLRTLMSADLGGYDLYRARFQLENGSSQESLTINLDASAVVQDATVGGESIAATIQDGQLVIPGLNASRRDIVEVIYRVPVQVNILHERRRIIVPNVSAQVLGFFWEFGIPPSSRMLVEPSGVRLTRSIPTASWKEHLLGPLGRPVGESLFNPFRYDSWIQLIQPSLDAMRFTQDPDGELTAPTEWQVHQAVLPEAPTELWVELWNASRVKLLAWIILGFCLILGVVLRILGWARRDFLAAYWLGLCLAATFSVSAPYAEFLGAAIAGTLIALLVPRHLIRKTVAVEDVTVDRPRSAQGIVIVGLAGAMTFFTLSSIIASPALAQEAPSDDAAAQKRPTVYVAVDKDGQPSETLPLVYVSREVLARWKSAAGDHGVEPHYLISSAQYDVRFAADGNLNLDAKYRVHLIRSGEQNTPVALALSDVSLPDVESCRVDGKPHAISALGSGKGYLIELERASTGSSSATAHGDHEVTTHEIELRARKTRPASNSLELRIPPVVNSGLTCTFPEPQAYVEIIGRQGALSRDADLRSVTTDLGATSSMHARWGTSAPPKKPAQVSVSLLQHLELRPALAELSFHCIATIDEGSVDALEFEIPANAIVRKNQLRTDDLLRSDVVVNKDGQRRLRLVFDKTRQSPIRVDGTLILVQNDSLMQTRFPQFKIASTELVQAREEQNWWGVSSSPDFLLEKGNLDPENVTMISPDAYLNAWVEAADPRHPESFIPRLPHVTFELTGNIFPTFVLVPQPSRRRAIHWRQTGSIGKRRLEWSLVGEIEPNQANQQATFQTVLLVDRRLRIEKITVTENDADRRFRWTESRGDPSRVVLFLNEKSQSKQTITVRGSMPITSGTPIVLPTIRPEDSDIVDARVMLTHDLDVDVAYTLPREWKNIVGEEAVTVESPATLGYFQVADLQARTTVQTSSRHSRCGSRAAVVLRRVDGSGWQLKARFELTPQGESPLRIGMTFPESFTDLNAVTVERAEPAWQEIHDGVRPLDLLLNRGEGPGTVIVQFETLLPEPRQADWELPLPTAVSASSQEMSLAIDPGAVWFPSSGVEVRVADLPEWSSDFYSDLPGSETAFKIPKSPVQLRRDVVASELRDPSIRLLDQRMWLHAGGLRSGITQAFLSSIRNDLEFEVPSQINVTSVFLDEQPLPLVTPEEGRLKIPMTDAGTESLLTITWISSDNHTGPRSETEQFLWPRDIRVDRNLVTILPDDPTALWNRGGLQEISPLDQGLDRLETLLDRHAALGDGTRAAIANRWLLDQLQTRLASRITREVRNPTSSSSQRLERWNRIVNATNQLEQVVAVPSIGWDARLLEGPVTDSAAALRGHATQSGQVRFWQFDQRVLFAICSFCTALILIPVFRRTIRVEWSRWLHRNASFSWFLLALVWWLFLTPSALGPILLMAGLVRAATQSTAAASRPSTATGLRTSDAG